MDVITSNTILYCSQWKETVQFYRDCLKLTINFSTDWFVEFSIGPASRLSIADEKRATIKSSRGKGITLSLEVPDIEDAWRVAEKTGLNPTTAEKHAWDALVFYIFDPEGHRVEIWQSTVK